LHQPATVAQIQEQFGPQFLEPTPDGGWAIAPEVLVEFVRSTPDGVVWDGRACLWRTREPADPPGARVVG
ncbi:MAG TPA: hypothetical protein VKY74_07815, partial [Chloroflexia bacterium]|nr:hypothetical protein [Chloroflexia bacterium]